MSTHTYRAGFGLAFSKTRDVRLFEQMALKGYRPVALNLLGFYKFEKCEPEDVIFEADCVDLDEKSVEFENYKELFAQSGWDFVCGKCGCYFFKAPKGATSLYTDGQSESVMWREMAKKILPFSIVLLAFFAVFITAVLVLGIAPDDPLFWGAVAAITLSNAIMIFGVARCYYFANKALQAEKG